jgi:hypothetical protein
MPEIEPLLTEQEVSRTLKVAVQTLRNWRTTGRGPAFAKMGPLVRYPPQSVRDYTEARTRRPEKAA